jgi:hypothetical protein
MNYERRMIERVEACSIWYLHQSSRLVDAGTTFADVSSETFPQAYIGGTTRRESQPEL